MDKYSYSGEDFKAVLTTEGWKIGLLKYSKRFSKLCVWERHLKTDEVFVLLHGSATLYIKNSDETVENIQMENGIVYNVPKCEWHHIVVSEDALVMVVENSDTSKENTEKVELI